MNKVPALLMLTALQSLLALVEKSDAKGKQAGKVQGARVVRIGTYKAVKRGWPVHS